ncbi:MAG: class I SAM-dependent methyltransferase [Pseudomonadales bacterium]
MRLFHHPAAAPLADPWRDTFQVACAAAPPADVQEPFLWAGDDRLELHFAPAAGSRRRGVWVDLAELQRRARQGGGLLRACGVRGGAAPSVLDVMAGAGVDGLVLAARGCRVTLIERQPAVSAMQQDLARRSGLTGVTCRHGDGFEALSALPAHDVVYLDPMFPPRAKTALPDKRLQMLALLAEPDARPLSAWLEAALAHAGDRVVLKRRSKDPVLATPDWQIRGRTVRFDVYRSRR